MSIEETAETMNKEIPSQAGKEDEQITLEGITPSAREALLEYLGSKPHNEVAHLVRALEGSITTNIMRSQLEKALSGKE